ncbi:MAG: ATP-binding protein, partial [Aureispira sp.]|nr:ATP-binding protein [Aureispira sp.]
MNNKIYPFKFLDSYTEEDKDIFFGRDEEVNQLYQMIYQSDILLLYGASGTGKTSLIQCGLASKFQKHDWLEVFVRRHKNLNESLHKSLIAVGGQNEESKESTENLDWLDDIMENDQEPDVATKKMSETQVFLKNIYLKHFRPIYLIFDQFEELFILGSKEEQAQFIATIQEILKVEQPVKLIFSIREEYLGSLYEFERAVPELFRKKLRIDPMNLGNVKDVVLGATSSKKSIVHINEEEAEAIAEQVFEKIRGKEKTLTIQLPYLQVFLDKFYRHISKDKSKTPTTEATFNLKSLAEIGDIGDILRDFLDEQIVEIAKDQDCARKTIWKILSPFVTIDGTKEPIGIDRLDQNFPDIPKELIEHVVIALMNNRILRYIEEEELYEIAHDSLALRIAEKRSDDEIALLEVRNLIKSQSMLKDEARELFSEKQLDFISPFLKRLKLSSEETKLIEESKQEVIRAQKEATRKKRVTQISVSVFIVVLLILLGFSWL